MPRAPPNSPRAGLVQPGSLLGGAQRGRAVELPASGREHWMAFCCTLHKEPGVRDPCRGSGGGMETPKLDVQCLHSGRNGCREWTGPLPPLCLLCFPGRNTTRQAQAGCGCLRLECWVLAALRCTQVFTHNCGQEKPIQRLRQGFPRGEYGQCVIFLPPFFLHLIIRAIFFCLLSFLPHLCRHLVGGKIFFWRVRPPAWFCRV